MIALRKKNEEENQLPTEVETETPKKDKTFLNSILILVIAFLSAALSASGFSLWSAQNDIKQANKELQDNILSTYTTAVNTSVAHLQKDLIFAAETLNVAIKNDPILQELDADAISKLIDLAKPHLEGAIEVRILPLGQYDLNKEIYPPVNFAAQKLLLQAEKAETNFPEFNQHPEGNYISLAQAIFDESSHELLASILVSYPAVTLKKQLPNNNIAGVQVSLVQQFKADNGMNIFQAGQVEGNKISSFTQNTSHPSWIIKYSSSKEASLLSDAIKTSGIGLALNTSIALIAIWVTFLLLKRKLETDLSLIFEYLRSDSKKPLNKSLFKTTLFGSFYQKISELSLNISPTNEKRSGKSTQKENILDIEIAKGDENLFGSDDEPGSTSASSSVPSQNTIVAPSIFRAYDIRGIVDETLTENTVKLIGQAIGSAALEHDERTVIVARDGRLSGPTLITALTEGILSSGANVIDVGMVPTPLLYFACKTLDSKSGVVLTGSHNPANHNGLKIVIAGKTLSGDDIQSLRTHIESNDLKTGAGSRSESEIIPAYLDAVVNDVILAQPIDIVIDCGNGVTGVIAEELFSQIGCNVTALNNEVDGNFPNHHPDPSRPENLEELISKVKETGAALGIAFDGDGDRLGLVTNTGKIIWPDRLMMLFAKDILLRSPGADIIFDVKCSQTLAEVIREQGGRPLMWKTGHSLIKAKLQETGAQIAGEMSGHIFFNDRWYGFDDALYSAARLLEILSTDSATAEEIFAAFPEKVSTPEINIQVTDENKFDIMEVLSSLGEFGEGGNKTTIDGVRIDYSYGWGLVRASNTTAVLVARFEADTEAQLKNIQSVFREQLLKIESTLDLPF